MKKISSIALIFLITAILGGALSYVRAAYIEPSGAPVGNNTPSPVLIGDVSGSFPGFFKMGKLGVTNSKNSNAVDENQFTQSTLVVMGQTSTESFTSAYSNRIRAELVSSSQLFPLFVGDPTNNSFMQTNPKDSSPLTFKVSGHTRAPRMVIGSRTRPGNLYHLYLVEGSNSTNLGKSGDSGNYTPGYSPNNKTSFCTITDAQLKNTGCPAMSYMGQIFPDPNPGSNGDVVATCHQTTPQTSSSPYSNFNKGACY